MMMPTPQPTLKINPLDELRIAKVVLQVTAQIYDLDISDLLSEYRDRSLNFARALICFTLDVETDLTKKQIGSLLGGRDASTVSDAIEVARARPDLFLVASQRIWAATLDAFPVRESACPCCSGTGSVLVPA